MQVQRTRRQDARGRGCDWLHAAGDSGGIGPRVHGPAAARNHQLDRLRARWRELARLHLPDHRLQRHTARRQRRGRSGLAPGRRPRPAAHVGR